VLHLPCETYPRPASICFMALLAPQHRPLANNALPPPSAGVDLFSRMELQDVLKLHIVPDMAIDPTTLKASDFAGADFLQLTANKTLLSSVTKQSLCPNTTKAPLDVTVGATLKPGEHTPALGQQQTC
jgi:hypothetical protein